MQSRTGSAKTERADTIIQQKTLDSFKAYSNQTHLNRRQFSEKHNELLSYYEKYIDLTCLFQNINEFISIVPHPSFQSKSIDNYLYELENILGKISGLFCCCFDYNQIDKLKEIYKYIINKILNQKEAGVNQLKDNEFSFFFSLYRSFGVFINSFCFNYSFLH